MNLKKLRELAEAATPGPWYHCQPFQRVEKQRTIHGPVPAQRVDFVSTCKEPVHKEVVLPMQGREANIKSENMAFIAAINPQHLIALLDLVELQHTLLRETGLEWRRIKEALATYDKLNQEDVWDASKHGTGPLQGDYK
jgi:hypothetical protein